VTAHLNAPRAESLAIDSLSIDSVIGLMLMVGVRGRVGDVVFERDLAACAGAKVGGVILFDVHLPEFVRRRAGGENDAAARLGAVRNIVSPEQAAALSAEIRGRLGRSAMISVDQEGGRVARFGPARGFPPTPSPAEFASMDAAHREHAAASLVRSVRDAGADVNFTPCIDAAVNPDNPIIAGKQRSFGVNVDEIAECAESVVRAHAAAGVVTCLKHFPGHGSSEGDTHAGFVDVTSTWRADPELAVYQRLVPRIDPRDTMVMTGHLFHAGIDKDHPASLSHAHTTGLLRGVLGFSGVVVTDSLDMGAVTQRYGMDEALLLAVNAGADILLDGFNGVPAGGSNAGEPDHPAPRMHEAISKALRDGGIHGGEARLRQSARRILGLRRWSQADMMSA
jgi:beta-N-acetylhexosaminidase